MFFFKTPCVDRLDSAGLCTAQLATFNTSPLLMPLSVRVTDRQCRGGLPSYIQCRREREREVVFLHLSDSVSPPCLSPLSFIYTHAHYS